MPAFLTNNSSQCCCAEMRCCAPNVVAAQLNGFAGVLTRRWIARITNELDPVNNGILELENGIHACVYESGAPPGCTEYAVPHWSEPRYTDESIYPGCINAQIVWPAIAFPQYDVLTDQGYLCFGGNPYHSGFEENEAVAEKCEAAALLCQKPTTDASSLYYGPGTSDRVNMADLNRDPYICHRTRRDQRPEFEAKVQRTQPRGEGDTDARLVFDVFCRRDWVYYAPCRADIIFNLTCTVLDDPPPDSPEGDWYCIDYRCGPRLPPETEGGDLCTQYRCTAHEGTVWPHLIAQPENENWTAVIKLNLLPDSYFRNTQYSYQAAKPQKPIAWRVQSAQILDGGEDYTVGDFFVVDFDPFFLPLLGGGEINVGFPPSDYNCFGMPLQWEDRYGLEPEEDEFGNKRFLQRLRVSEVDDNGAILGVEIVPWFRTPEFLPESCIDEITDNDEKTPYFPSYSRVICHPNSVDIGGSGYLIGNDITFVPISPGVQTYSAAVAEVTDVDDDGAVLDWKIKGSDIWRYGFGLGNPSCAYDFSEPDERGAYLWEDKLLLCDLYWDGIGNPVRSVARQTDGFTDLDTTVNTGALTSISLSISRVPCRTAIGMFISNYKYESPIWLLELEGEDPDFDDLLLRDLPPYPRCAGGGAQITPIIGTEGGNESAIGGPLAGGVVMSAGAYYAFRDRRHVEPILPPSPAGGSGRGLTVSYTFGEVLNFPRPGYAAGERFVPDARRFAYFPVTAVSIVNGGQEYEVGQEFDVFPAGGAAFSHAWKRTGGDHPDVVVNGSWYTGALAVTDSNGHLTPFGGQARSSVCRLRVAEVDENGAVTDLEVVDGGMMFRPVWAGGVKCPDVFDVVNSDTGMGAKVLITVDTDAESETFGQVISCDVVAMPIEEGIDPLHSTVESPAPYPVGGRDYANPESGYMWEMNDIIAGAGATQATASLTSKIDWHNFVHNHYHPSDSPFVKIEGEHIPFRRRAEDCTLDECYHSLLNRTYPLYTRWADINGPPGSDTQNLVNLGIGGCVLPGWPNSYSPLPFGGDDTWWMLGRPKTNYAIYRKADRSTEVFETVPTTPFDLFDCDTKTRLLTENPEYDGPPIAYPGDYAIVEWGMSVSLSAAIPVYPNCPDEEDGRTSK